MSDSIDIQYDEPKFQGPSMPVFLEQLVGQLPQVSSAPTWTPRAFFDRFAIYKNGSTYRFYFYVSADNSWRYLTGT
jgi:hypothetical protein